MNSDYAVDVTDPKSMSGYFVKLGLAPYSSAPKKQNSVALLACKAEFYALTDAAKEVIWICQIMTEAGCKSRDAVPIWSDDA